MSDAHDNRFDEALLSGYLDGELTQADEQKVRLHLQESAEARREIEELQKIREAAMSTTFPRPDDRQWDETPRSGLSAFLRNFGWMVLVIWVVGLSGFMIWQLVMDGENLVEKLLAFGVWFGLGLVFVSVLLDRLKSYKTDRYRRVEK